MNMFKEVELFGSLVGILLTFIVLTVAYFVFNFILTSLGVIVDRQVYAIFLAVAVAVVFKAKVYG